MPIKHFPLKVMYLAGSSTEHKNHVWEVKEVEVWLLR